MSHITDKKLLNRTRPTNPETDPIVDPDWDDVIPVGRSCELRAPELAVKIGSEPTGPDVERVGGSATLASEAKQPPAPFDSDAESQDEQQLVATITELWSSSKTTKSSRAELADYDANSGCDSTPTKPC